MNDGNSPGTEDTGAVWEPRLPSDPALTLKKILHTGGLGHGGAVEGAQEVVVLRHGAGACVYLSDVGSADVAAFVYPASRAWGGTFFRRASFTRSSRFRWRRAHREEHMTNRNREISYGSG